MIVQHLNLTRGTAAAATQSELAAGRTVGVHQPAAGSQHAFLRNAFRRCGGIALLQ